MLKQYVRSVPLGALFLLVLCMPFQVQAARLFLVGPQTAVGLGDTLTVQVMIDTQGQEITSASVFVSFDAAVFVPISTNATAGPVKPFVTGDFLNGQVYENALAGDLVDASRANELNGFQLNYTVVSGLSLAGDRAVAKGQGTVASFRLRVVGVPTNDGGFVQLDTRGQRRPIYTRFTNPGMEYGFQVESMGLQISIDPRGLIPIADQVLVPGDRVEIDLLQHYLGAETPPKWFFTTATPQDLTVTVEESHLIVLAAPTASGQRVVEYQVISLTGELVTGYFTVVLMPLQRLAKRTLEWNEDVGWVEYALRTFLLDEENGSLYNWRVGSGGWVEAEIVDGYLRVRAPDEWSGTDALLLELLVDGVVVERMSLTVRVQMQNDAPTVHLPPTATLKIGEQHVSQLLKVLVEDVDHDTDVLDIRVQGDDKVRVEIRDDRLVVQGLEAGVGTVHIIVRDPQGLETEGIWQVVVTALGIEPILGFLPSLILVAGETQTLNLADLASDADTPLEHLLWDWNLEGPIQATLLADGIHLRIRGQAEGTARVYLEVRDEQGNFASGVIPVEIMPERSIATQVETQIQVEDLEPSIFPNPFNAAVNLKFSLANSKHVRLEIIDVQGRLVTQLVDGWMPAGFNQVVWDGFDKQGRQVASGLYLYVLASSQRRWSGHMLLVR